MLIKNEQNEQNDLEFYSCCLCDYYTLVKSNFIRHTKTKKHKNTVNTNDTNNSANFTEQKGATYFDCCCGKIYKFQSSLCFHKKKCTFIEETSKVIDSKTNEIMQENLDTSKPDYQSMFLKLLDENSEFKNILITQQNQLMDQQKQIGELIPKVGNNNNNTNIKQKFNINIFLNEQCKDALNMKDFIKQITVTLENLDITKSKGLTEGLSNVFIENMNKLSVFERPMHCTDTKREILYIKENDIWEKDNDKSKIRDAIKSVSAIQYKNMKQWMDANPDYMDDPDKQDYFIHMVKNCGKSINDIDDKIIRRLCLSSYIKDILNEQMNKQITE